MSKYLKIKSLALAALMALPLKPAEAGQAFIRFDEEACRAIVAMENIPAGIDYQATGWTLFLQGAAQIGATLLYLDHIKDSADRRCIADEQEKMTDRFIEKVFRYCVENIGTAREKDLLIKSGEPQVWPYNRFTWTKPVRRNFAADGVLRKAANMRFVGGTSNPSRYFQDRREVLDLARNCKLVNKAQGDLLSFLLDIDDYIRSQPSS